MTQLNASRFSKQFSLTTPIALAPMALASGGALAAANPAIMREFVAGITPRTP